MLLWRDIMYLDLIRCIKFNCDILKKQRKSNEKFYASLTMYWFDPARSDFYSANRNKKHVCQVSSMYL